MGGGKRIKALRSDPYSFFRSKLNFMPLEQEMPVQFQVVELPSGHHLCKVRALNKGDANSEVTVYYQVSWPLYRWPSSWLSIFRALKPKY